MSRLMDGYLSAISRFPKNGLERKDPALGGASSWVEMQAPPGGECPWECYRGLPASSMAGEVWKPTKLRSAAASM
jgi:hypothetical protein